MADLEQQVYEAVKATLDTALTPFASDIDVFIPNGPTVDLANQDRPWVQWELTFDRVSRGSLGHSPVQVVQGNLAVGVFEKNGTSIWYTSQIKTALREALFGGYVGPAEFLSAQSVSAVAGMRLPEWHSAAMQYQFRVNDCP